MKLGERYINKLRIVVSDPEDLKILDAYKRITDTIIYQKIIVDSIFQESIEIIKPTTGTNAIATPEIDGLNSQLSPSVQLAGEFKAGRKFKFDGNIFTGNNLNDKSNKEALYNLNSSTYGINLEGVFRTNLTNSISISLGGFTSFTGKSLFRDTTTAVNFNYFQANFSAEIILFNGFSFYFGRNYARPLNEIASLQEMLRFKSEETSTSVYQTYSNIGFRGQYSFTENKDYSLALDINGIKLNKDLQATLDESKDPFLIVIKLSLTKNL